MPAHLIYGPPAKENPRLAALRSLSEDQRDNQILEASRDRNEKMAEGIPAFATSGAYYRAVQLAEAMHKARVEHAERHFNPRRYPTPEDPTHLDHAIQWLEYQLHEMGKSPEPDPAQAQRMVTQEEWAGNLRDQMLDRIARREAEALGYGFS